MPKELVISATPHETRVAIVEDGQLCEIYVEREKEFALVGSVYKGRVTRVLPGMQSAFVDIGLDSDAFLYVSDFLEGLEEYDHIVTTVEEKFQKMEDQGGQVFAQAPAPGGAVEPPEVAAAAAEAPPADAAITAAPPAEQRLPGESRAALPGETRPAPEAMEMLPGEKRSAGPVPAAPHAPVRSNSYEPRGYGRDRGSRGDRGDRGDRGGRRRGQRGGRGRDQRHVFGHGRELPPSKFVSHRPYEPPGEEAGPEPILLPGESLARLKDRAPGFPPASVTPAPSSTPHLSALPGETLQAAPGEAAVDTAARPDTLAPLVPEVGDEPAARPEEHTAANSHPELTAEEAASLAEHVADVQEEEAEAEAAAAAEAEAAAEDALDESEAAGEEDLESAGMMAEEAEAAESFEAPEEAEPKAGQEMDAAPAENGTPATPEERQPTTARVEHHARPRFQRPMRRGERDRDRQRGGRHGRPHPRHQGQRGPRPQISEMLKAGQEIIVQIAKEPLGKKGARITSHVALPGRFLVYMPTVDHVGVSRKISSSDDRARLRRLVTEAMGMFPGGFIVRTAAEGATDEEIRTDVEYLGRTWADVRQRAEQRKAPTLLHRDLNLVERILRDHMGPEFTSIWIDSEEEFTKVVDFVNRFQPELVSRVKLYTRPAPIFEEFGIQQEIDKALRPKVWLKSGGYIVINHTEALVAIDINTGKFVGKGSTRLEDTIVKTNLEAVKEIVRQIRLRDLGGIIVIDFIDMEERKNRQKVMQALEDALREDKAPSKVLSFNEFGLVSITRKRTKQALERTLCQPCPYCTGSGMVKSAPTLCYEIQTEARKMAKEMDGQSLTLRVHPEIAKALKTRESVLIDELEQWTRKSVIIQSDPALHWEQYDIF